MKIGYLDCFSGISGDMLLGALVDAGVPMSLLQETVRALNVGAEITAARVDRNGISATKVDVIVGGVKDMPREEFLAQKHDHEHSHEHTHADGTTHSHPHADKAHSHEHSHEHTHADGTKHSHPHEHGHSHEHRGLKEIRAIINHAQIPAGAKKRALQAFQLLG